MTEDLKKSKGTFDTLYETTKDTTEIVVGVNANDEDIVFVIAESGNKAHTKIQRRYAKQLERARFNEKRQNILMAEVTAKALLISWNGVLDKDGNEIEPTYENKKDALIKHRKLFLEVLETANDTGNFQDDEEDMSAEEAKQDTEKNSEGA